MGLETTTYINGLTPAWPLAGDNKSQGDDHIRLLKQTLQNTFPTASKPFYFPKAEPVSASQTLDATDQNNSMILDTTAGNLAVTLPTLTSSDVGWQCSIIKGSTDVNRIQVTPASGNVKTRVGTVASICVGVPFEPAFFMWDGTSWYCFKPGVVIGSIIMLDVATTPPGFLLLDGSAYSNTVYTELFAILGSSTLKDHRGRLEIGDGTGSGLTARVAGTTYGAESVALGTANLPPYTPSGSVASLTNFGNNVVMFSSSAATSSPAGGPQTTFPGAGTQTAILSVTSTFAGNAQGGTSTPFSVLNPTIGVRKVIRAC